MDWPGIKPGFQGREPRVLSLDDQPIYVFLFFEYFKSLSEFNNYNRKSAGFIVIFY